MWVFLICNCLFFYFPTLGSIFKLCVTPGYLVFICRAYLRPWESAVLATEQDAPFMSFSTALGCLLLRSLRASKWIPIRVDFLGPPSVASIIIYLGILENLLALVWLKMHMICCLCVLCDYFIKWICGPVEMLCSKGVLFSLVRIIVYGSMTSNVVHVWLTGFHPNWIPHTCKAFGRWIL